MKTFLAIFVALLLCSMAFAEERSGIPLGKGVVTLGMSFQQFGFLWEAAGEPDAAYDKEQDGSITVRLTDPVVDESGFPCARGCNYAFIFKNLKVSTLVVSNLRSQLAAEAFLNAFYGTTSFKTKHTTKDSRNIYWKGKFSSANLFVAEFGPKATVMIFFRSAREAGK